MDRSNPERDSEATVALQFLPQNEADATVETLFDVAPTDGDAEGKPAPELGDHRDEIFLGCKIRKRDDEGAREELEASLDRLRVERIDRYQFHAVTGKTEDCLRFALSQGLITVASSGDPDLVPDVLAAAEGFEATSEAERDQLRDARRNEETPVPTE